MRIEPKGKRGQTVQVVSHQRQQKENENSRKRGDYNSNMKGKKSNRPKRKSSCKKRHMKWNSKSKRCNKNK
jgi:hypothetical protein